MKKKTKKKADKKPLEEPKKQVLSENNDGEKPFDFGGIPDRDLKKNLGCG